MKIFRAKWRVTAALILLSLIPLLAGVFRVVGLASGVEITSENVRFFESPIPVVLHIISAITFCVLGAFQFNSDFRNSSPFWHRTAGRVLIPSGIIAALTGLWMTQFYPLYPQHQDHILYIVRLLVGFSTVSALLLGFIFILQKKIKQHSAWVIRSYALIQGAGTQALIGIPLFLIMGDLAHAYKTWVLIWGWLVNIALAEIIILKHKI